MKILSPAMKFIIISAFLSNSAFGASVSFDLSKTSGTLQPENLTGTCLPIWNSAQTYKTIKKGLETSGYRLFRFPNGSLSNGYHWNGSGAYNNDSVWVSDSSTYKPGFMSMTRHRGTSVNSFGFVGSSNITDGDTSTFWRSDELISGSAPYFYLELQKSTLVDSIVIMWGDKYAVDFDIDFFKNPAPYPGPFKYQSDFWQNQKRVTGNGEHVFSSALPSTAAWYVRVLVNAFKGGEQCVEVKEVYLYAQGKLVTSHSKKYSGASGAGDQTRVIAMPTSESSIVRPDYATGWVNWDFESYITYIHSISDSAVPVICVNYGTGTPQEAAAWVHYANKEKNYNVRYWQIGNEMDGEWEEGGPVNAAMYAEKYLLFAKAMKLADSTIKIFGPLHSNADFYARNSGVFDNKSWMRSFIDYVGEREKADGKKYCDGIDFHSYPYYSTSANAAELMGKIDYVYGQSDSLALWIKASLADPDSVYVMMSEYNSSVVMSDLLQRPSNGIFTANMFAGLAEKFGDRAMSVFWDSYEGLSRGPNGTYGALSLFNTFPGWSSMGMAPSAAYWALFCAQNLWINPSASLGENAVVPAVFNRTGAIRAYGIKTGADFRALVMNVSFAPETLSCSLTGGTYSRADVFTWGENQFKWTGSGASAYAFPNCGPSSYSTSADSIVSIVIPGQALCVVRFNNADSAAGGAPELLHWSINLPAKSSKLFVCGSAYAENSAVTAIDYAFDTASVSTMARSIDGGFDGPSESFFDSLSLVGLAAGPHILHIKAHAGTQSVADSVQFSLMTAINPIQRRNSGYGETVPGIIAQPLANGVRISLHGYDRSGLQARVLGLNGACVKELSCVENNGFVSVQWKGEDAGDKKVARGVYVVVLKSAGAVIYKRPMVAGR